MNFSKKKLWLIFIVAAHAPFLSAMEGEEYSSDNSDTAFQDSPSEDAIQERFERLQKNRYYTIGKEDLRTQKARDDYDQIIKQSLKSEPTSSDKDIITKSSSKAEDRQKERLRMLTQAVDNNPNNPQTEQMVFERRDNLLKTDPNISYHDAFMQAAKEFINPEPAATEQPDATNMTSDTASNNPASEENDPNQLNTANMLPDDTLSDWDYLEKPKTRYQRVTEFLSTKLSNVQDAVTAKLTTGKQSAQDVAARIAQSRPAKSLQEGIQTAKDQLNKFEDWINNLSKQPTIEDVSANIRNQRNKNANTFTNRGLDAIKKQVLENITAQDLQTRANAEVKKFEDQVGSLSVGSGDSAGVFIKRLTTIRNILTENAELLQTQFDTFNIPKIVAVAEPPKESDNYLNPKFYKFEIIDLSKVDTVLQEMISTSNIAQDQSPENINRLNKELTAVAYKLKITQKLNLSTPEIVENLKQYLEKRYTEKIRTAPAPLRQRQALGLNEPDDKDNNMWA